MMGGFASEHEIVDELGQWTMESGEPLPLPMSDMVWAERCGVVVDLASGERFYPVDKWDDFAERWVWEIVRRGDRPTVDRLAKAFQRANDYGWDGGLCRAVAHVMLDRAMRKVCTVQVA